MVRSFIFDGSNDEISCSAGSDFDFGGGDFTLETWLNMDTIGAGQAILEFDWTKFCDFFFWDPMHFSTG